MKEQFSRLFLILILTGLTSWGVKAQAYLPLDLSEVKAEGWIKTQIARDWSGGSFSVMWNNSFFPTTLGPLRAGSNVTTKFKDNQGRLVYQWNYGEMEGNLVDAAVRAMFLADNAALKTRFKIVMDFMADSIAATQYVDSLAYASYTGGELFGQTCMQRAMLAYYEYTGEQKYYDAVKVMVDKTIIQWNRKFDEGKTYFGRDFAKKGAMNHSLTYGDILEYLYLHTGDRKYVDFAFRLYNDFTKYVDRVGDGDDGGADTALDNLINSNTMFYGHGPHTAEQLRMPLWLSVFAKDSSDVLRTKYELALANIPLKLNKSLSPSKGLVTDPLKHESVNGKYSSGYFPYEYCSLTETMNTLGFRCRLSGDKESAEVAEILFVNAAQGARFPDGKANTYLVCDNVDKAITERNWRDQYSALHGIRCCNLNAARIAPNYVANMWMKNAGTAELIAMLHGPSSVETILNGVRVHIIADTDYPFENTLRYKITAASPVEFTLVVRDPEWSANTKVTADGATVDLSDGFFRIKKIWGTSQQTIELTLDEQILIRKLDNPDSKDFYIQRGALIYTYPYENEKTMTQARSGFPGYYHWDIQIPETMSTDYAGMGMLTGSATYLGTDSSYLRYQASNPFMPEYPFDFPSGKITGRFTLDNRVIERDLIPMGCTTTRRTTFTPVAQLASLAQVTITLQGRRMLAPGESEQYVAVVKSQFNTTFSNPELTWSATGGTITQNGYFIADGSGSPAVITVSTGTISSEFKIVVDDGTVTRSPDFSGNFVYPTITDGIIFLSGQLPEVRMYSVEGKEVQADKPVDGKIDIRYLPRGYYLLKAGDYTTAIIKN